MNLSDYPYWIRRALEEEEDVYDTAVNKIVPAVLLAYRNAQRQLIELIRQIYRRDALDILNVLDSPVRITKLTNLTRQARQIEDENTRRQVKLYINSLAARPRVTELERLIATAFIVIKQVASIQAEAQTNFHVDIVYRAFKQASAEAIIGKAEINNTPIEDLETVKRISTGGVRNILNTRWFGKNYYERIQSDTNALIKELNALFTNEVFPQRSEREMIREVRDIFNASEKIAVRLIRTEAAFIQGQAKLKAWRENSVEKYVLVAVLDFRTSLFCRNIDGEVFLITSAVVGFNFPPFHPRCRTIAMSYFGRHSLTGTRFATDEITGEVTRVPKRINYREWEQRLIEKHGVDAIEIARQKIKNYTRDKEQWRRYKAVLGVEELRFFDDFQELKYTQSDKWEELKTKFRKANR